MHDFDIEVDVTGTSCPVPLIQLAKTTGQMSSGQILKITGDDPIFETAVRDYCEVQSMEVLDAQIVSGRTVTVYIRC